MSFSGRTPTFQRTILPLSSPLDLWNVGILQQQYTASQPRRLRLEISPPWKPQNSQNKLEFLWVILLYQRLQYAHKGKVVPVTQWRGMGSVGIASCILNLGSRWKWVVSSAPRPLYHRSKSPRIHWVGGCGWTPVAVWTWRRWEKSLLPVQGIELRSSSP
jgi:hypothetical protein